MLTLRKPAAAAATTAPAMMYWGAVCSVFMTPLRKPFRAPGLLGALSASGSFRGVGGSTYLLRGMAGPAHHDCVEAVLEGVCALLTPLQHTADVIVCKQVPMGTSCRVLRAWQMPCSTDQRLISAQQVPAGHSPCIADSICIADSTCICNVCQGPCSSRSCQYCSGGCMP